MNTKPRTRPTISLSRRVNVGAVDPLDAEDTVGLVGMEPVVLELEVELASLAEVDSAEIVVEIVVLKPKSELNSTTEVGPRVGVLVLICVVM